MRYASAPYEENVMNELEKIHSCSAVDEANVVRLIARGYKLSANKKYSAERYVVIGTPMKRSEHH